MRKLISLGTLATASCLTLLAVPAYASDGPVLKIENFIGTVEIVTGDYNKISITDADGANFSRSGNGLELNDDVSIRSYQCRYKKAGSSKEMPMVGKGKWSWTKGGKNYRNISEYPLVKITAPANTHLEIDKSIIFGAVGNIGSAHLHIGSCGDMVFGDVNGDLDLSISGSGDITLGSAGVSEISVSGAGDLIAGNLASADISVSGSGDLTLGNIAGFADIGSSGAGDVEIGNIGGGLNIHSSGASDLEVESVTGGYLSIRVSGSSDVTIAGGSVDTLFIKASGASDVTYNGSSVDAEARANGASDIYIHNPSGNLRTSDSGAADVNIR